MSVTIYHNPRCSKSRETLALLEQHGHTPIVVEYLKTPLSSEEIKTLIEQLGFGSAHDLLRTKEDEYKEHGLSKSSSEDDIIAAMVTAPKLIERPIVVTNGKAAVGRPPESVLALF
ncbi:arsenate reductase (glutaredoxin) [Pseudoalteromonas xiamenensis]|uniref:arsenate reductase (glutaredoxin) n=1 Tax=Pseudoalteromonas xiamenensis TaxID=882626 RepID=UPI0035EB7AF4